MNSKEELKSDIHHRPTRVGEPIPPISPLRPVLEAYSIKREIGRGGMAIVYEAVEKSLNRVVALKVMSRELSKDTDLIRRFVNEAQAAARLSHPNIVQIYSIGQEKNVYYFAMEYVRGESVESMLEDGKKIPILQSINIIKQTALALNEAYKNNIVHRDVKPGNLLVTEQGVVKVADFGLAAEVKDASAAIGGKIIGTPLYISPEQAQGKEGDYRSDIYSLGITFYHMLSGKLPFTSSDTKELMKSHIQSLPPPLPVDIPVPVKKLVYRMTDKKPERRFQDYKYLIDELDKIKKMLTSKRYTFPILLMGLGLAIGVTMFSFYYKPIIRDLTLPLKIEKEKRIERIYKDVVEYAKQYPEAYGDIVKEYFNIMKKYPDTEWAFRAEQKIDMIILAVAKEAAEELNGLKSLRDKLISEARYKEAIDRYKGIKDKYKDTVAESFAQENIDYIIEEARKDFQLRTEQVNEYIAQYRFNKARKLYKEVIGSFGLEEFTKDAKDKLTFINEYEKEYKIESDARKIFEPVQADVQRLLTGNKFEQARKELKAIAKTKENPVLNELVEKEFTRIDELQIEYESAVLKERMESQYSRYNKINKKVDNFLTEYKYKEAVRLVERGIMDVEILEWRRNLKVLEEKLQYLALLKDSLINGINEELTGKKITDISASEDTLIFVVEGGYVGAPWKESSPQRIYKIASTYFADNTESHIALGVFCLTYGLLDSARKEFTRVLRMTPQKQEVVEKYLIQLAEADRG